MQRHQITTKCIKSTLKRENTFHNYIQAFRFFQFGVLALKRKLVFCYKGNDWS